jgi:hypothetical protein
VPGAIWIHRRSPHGTLHRADSNVAANVLHARDEHVSGVDKACGPENVSDYLHGSHLSPRQKSNLAHTRKCRRSDALRARRVVRQSAELQLVLTFEIDGDTENGARTPAPQLNPGISGHPGD